MDSLRLALGLSDLPLANALPLAERARFARGREKTPLAETSGVRRSSSARIGDAFNPADALAPSKQLALLFRVGWVEA